MLAMAEEGADVGARGCVKATSSLSFWTASWWSASEIVGESEFGGEEPRWLFMASLAKDDCCASRRPNPVVKKEVRKNVPRGMYGQSRVEEMKMNRSKGKRAGANEWSQRKKGLRTSLGNWNC